MNSDENIPERVATILQEIGSMRSQLDRLLDDPHCGRERHEVALEQQEIFEEMQLAIVRRYGQWKRGEITTAALLRDLPWEI